MTKQKRAQIEAAAAARLEAKHTYRTTDELETARSAAIQRETDRRSTTSRANLAGHIPERLDPSGRTAVVSVRLPSDVVAELDAEVKRSGLDRSTIIRWCLERSLPESKKVPPYQPW